MTSLYELSSTLQKKYSKSLAFNKETGFVRYHKRFFELLANGYEEYEPLFSAFETGVEKWMSTTLQYNPETTLTLDTYRTGHSILLEKEEYYMYLNFLEQVILPQLTEPPQGAKVWITTHTGGTHVAYYRNSHYEVPMASGELRIEDAVVIHWNPYEETYNPFTG